MSGPRPCHRGYQRYSPVLGAGGLTPVQCPPCSRCPVVTCYLYGQTASESKSGKGRTPSFLGGRTPPRPSLSPAHPVGAEGARACHCCCLSDNLLTKNLHRAQLTGTCGITKQRSRGRDAEGTSERRQTSAAASGECRARPGGRSPSTVGSPRRQQQRPAPSRLVPSLHRTQKRQSSQRESAGCCTPRPQHTTRPSTFPEEMQGPAVLAAGIK